MTAVTGARWLAREVVQTSSMDCGPAALKCLLDGFGIPASYGRLREACQTSIDGTSIDTLEDVAQQLGLRAEQVLVPADHVAQPGSADGPAIAVVRQADAGTHFVVVWRRVGARVQVMDPAAGRRWVGLRELRDMLYRHETLVDAAAWRDWAGSADHVGPLRRNLRALGVRDAGAKALVGRALADPHWMSIAALDAAARLVASLVDARAVRRGAEAMRLVKALFRRCVQRPHERLSAVPATYWSVLPEHGRRDDGAALRLHLRGAVLMRVAGTKVASAHAAGDEAAGDKAAADTAAPVAALGEELAAVLHDRAEPVWRTVWNIVREEGRLLPWALSLAVLLTTLAVALELLLFRGLFDLSSQLSGTGQSLAGVAVLLGFLALRPALEVPTVRETQRLGRHLETRLRARLLERLPQLHDRYFQSRPISDMADRAHGLQVARNVPGMALGLVQALFDLALTLAGLVWLADAAAVWAGAMALAAVAVPLLAMPMLSERDLGVRTHAAALAGFYLDALLGLVPVRAHRAERAVAREHEALLVLWARAMQRGITSALALEGVQGVLCVGLAVAFMASHFRSQGGVAGSDLLLVFWTLKIPALGSRIAALAQQLPAQRNALMRLLEPLSAAQPAAPAAPALPRDVLPAVAPSTPMAFGIEGGAVRAGGHEILRGIDLRVDPGEHVAVVGVSGAGKSSLVGLLLGWHRLAEGRMHVDGRILAPGAEGQMQALRPHIAWVDPAVQLWNRSLLDNLLYASDDESLDRVGLASERAQLRDLAARLPQGLQTLLGEGGGLLSGGEGQRVRLARALLQAHPRLVLLDEPFRGLDRPQRRALMREARAWWQRSTLLCVTHDVTETLQFPRVLVVQDGRIVEDGAPDRLVAAPSRYRELVDAELGLRKSLWGGKAWRRLELRDGLLAAGPGGTA